MCFGTGETLRIFGTLCVVVRERQLGHYMFSVGETHSTLGTLCVEVRERHKRQLAEWKWNLAQVWFHKHQALTSDIVKSAA